VLDGASKATLENEFGTSNDDECIIKLLEKGEVQQTQTQVWSRLTMPEMNVLEANNPGT
jgi:ribosome maturation protein Sdo1